MDKFFDKYLKEEDFINLSAEKLKKYGFEHNNTIAGVCLCRDEICQSVLLKIKNLWGDFFNFSSFAGIYSSGEIGAKVFISHAPDGEEKRVVFYVFTHIGLDEKGGIGICKRKGIEKSTACGALILFLNEILNFDKREKEENPELIFIKQKLRKEISNRTPDLKELTKIALHVSCNEIERTMENLVKSDKIIYALVSGIQVHYLDKNYIVPMESFVVRDNKRIDFKVL
ncbi:MAG: hypothetical protein N2647_02795 [Thermodesulfovibrio sp.]|nr:hypothetical protein [Thermodesulfovibrio sp.]